MDRDHPYRRLSTSPSPTHAPAYVRKLSVSRLTLILAFLSFVLTLGAFTLKHRTDSVLLPPFFLQHSSSSSDNSLTTLTPFNTSTRPFFISPPKYYTTNRTCPIPIEFTSDRSASDVFMSGVFDRANPATAKPWQPTAFFSLEAATRIAHRPMGKLMNEAWDIRTTYELDSDVPFTYMSLDGGATIDQLRAPPLPFEEKKKDFLVAAFISNCNSVHSGREYVFDELRRLLPGRVASYGKCHNNRQTKQDLPEGFSSPWGTEEKQAIIRQYLFTLAFENTNDIDYVTEKFYQPLQEGSVPIVLGAPNVRDQFMPNPKAALIVREFPSVAALASQILYLSTNATAYAEHLSWKTEPFSPEFEQVVETSLVSPMCRLAMLVKGVWRNGFQRRFGRERYVVGSGEVGRTLEDAGNKERFGGRKGG
ncbi:hypothetical protein MNV49_004547 [Pseudohyphozyma bogoriensis]|nr:hypothetical protein MNV49_004547 [Pseudohyphozyma bogoriensis]